ncbi:DUF2777 family protein [Texcoconibacillus texcoconensis]|uniref:DUF2777 family protein n=1 Tax=Texcoconibacillus texcoconensis TaxID=1095777 RepID=A0A840QQJ1_9BACI|nr:DUF2777 family protein [Texcoconibacillus texcoconensis]MBB5173608.1 hypothetical protein [Texcoconibacillus texcoconensis]
MNRKEAQAYLNQLVLIDKGDHGRYYGTLEDLIAEERKPWRGKVRITGVERYPKISSELSQLPKPVFAENDLVEEPGVNIFPCNDNSLSYNHSLADALKERWDQLQETYTNSEHLLTQIQQYMKQLKSEKLLTEDTYIYYQVFEKNGEMFMYDEEKGDKLAIEGCPFEFEIKTNGRWEPAHYDDHGHFITFDEKLIKLKPSDDVRLNKKQFDPYYILKNELEEPALDALESGMQRLGINHEHCMYCHNSLLIQLLSSIEEQEFSGVNFISYANENQQFIVQHHYERTIQDEEDDITFDRFEFTSDSGERLITTYATQVSNE